MMECNASMAKNLVIVVPVRNEAKFIRPSVDLIQSFFSNISDLDWKIVVADNGSSDDTENIVREMEKGYGTRLSYFSIPIAGRGNAVREAVKRFRADFFILIDVDVPIKKTAVLEFISALKDGTADIIVGKRDGNRPWYRKHMTRGWSTLARLFFGLHISDLQCGAQEFNRRAADLLRENCHEEKWFLYTEFLVTAHRAGLIIREIPVQWVEHRFAERKSRVNIMGDTLSGLAFLVRFSNRIYPRRLRNYVCLTLGGIALVLVLLLFYR